MPEDDLSLSTTTKELVRMAELDYERTAKLIEGVVGTAATTRGLLLTAWAAVLALAFDTGQWALAAASFAIVVVSGIIDAYHSWVYSQALVHATDLEKVSQVYHTAVARGADDPHLKTDLRVALDGHRFGVYTNIKQFSWKKPQWQAFRPKVFFQILYPGLLLVSIIATAILASTAAPQKCYSIQVQGTPAVGAGGVSGQANPPPVTVISPGERLSACESQQR